MTDTVPAAATGLPSFDRRSFLSTLIAAGVLSAGTVLPAAAADEHLDAELLELGSVLVGAEARRDAFDREADEALVPSPPVPILSEPSTFIARYFQSQVLSEPSR